MSSVSCEVTPARNFSSGARPSWILRSAASHRAVMSGCVATSGSPFALLEPRDLERTAETADYDVAASPEPLDRGGD